MPRESPLSLLAKVSTDRMISSVTASEGSWMAALIFEMESICDKTMVFESVVLNGPWLFET
jgi:hypothetical protein